MKLTRLRTQSCHESSSRSTNSRESNDDTDGMGQGLCTMSAILSVTAATYQREDTLGQGTDGDSRCGAFQREAEALSCHYALTEIDVQLQPEEEVKSRTDTVDGEPHPEIIPGVPPRPLVLRNTLYTSGLHTVLEEDAERYAESAKAAHNGSFGVSLLKLDGMGGSHNIRSLLVASRFLVGRMRGHGQKSGASAGGRSGVEKSWNKIVRLSSLSHAVHSGANTGPAIA